MARIIAKLQNKLLTFFLIELPYLIVTTYRNRRVKKHIYHNVSMVEGPHLRYMNEHGDAQLLFGDCVDDTMKLCVQNIKRPTAVRITKLGEQPISFSVPLKTEITIPDVNYQDNQNVFALSDVEGNFNAVVNLLRRHEVIDSKLRWSYGQGHLVILGDVFDRGNHVVELLWLIYRLEDEAAAAGGNVHLLLGNHEIMALSNCLRYAEPKYKYFDLLVRRELGIRYSDLFGLDTELGRWLRSKNVAINIGGTIFVHGGLSPELIKYKLTLKDINQSIRSAVAKSKKELTTIERFLLGQNGPLWYRGYFSSKLKPTKIGIDEVRDILYHYRAERIVVGHTIVDSPRVDFAGLILAVNVKHPADHLESCDISWGVEFLESKIRAVSTSGVITIG